MSSPAHPFNKSQSVRFEPDGQWEQALSGRPVYIRTFGCAYNAGDSDLLASVLKNRGSILVSDPAMADAVILNTCNRIVQRAEDVQGDQCVSWPEVYVTVASRSDDQPS
jgi:hypothetical protein